MHLELVTPSAVLLDLDQVESITLPSLKGELGILPGHRSALFRLGGGLLSYKAKDSGKAFVRGGFVEVTEDRVVILADEALLAIEENKVALNLQAGFQVESIAYESSFEDESSKDALQEQMEQQIAFDYAEAIRKYLVSL